MKKNILFLFFISAFMIGCGSGNIGSGTASSDAGNASNAGNISDAGSANNVGNASNGTNVNVIAQGIISHTSSCTSITNALFHINYYEMCGNNEQPVTTGKEISIAPWFEIDSPNSAVGKVWIDDLFLERSDMPGVNMISNASFEGGMWPAKNNALCLASNINCDGLNESDDKFVWELDSKNYYSGKNSAVADMSKLGLGYQTHIFQLIPVSNMPAGVRLKLSAMIKIEGDVQARLGIDLREVVVDPQKPKNSIKSPINGIILRGSTNGWRKIDLR